jgi:hypothetical protein
MANRAYLFQAPTPDVGVEYDPDQDILVGASYLLPVFWLALFDRSCLKRKDAEFDDGTKTTYPYLISSVSDGLARWDKRSPFLVSWLGPELGKVTDSWRRLIAGADKPYVHLETVELWMMEPEPFEGQLQDALDSFEAKKPSLVGRVFGTSSQATLQPALSLADIAGVPESSRMDKLYGYSWVRPVTWSE